MSFNSQCLLLLILVITSVFKNLVVQSILKEVKIYMNFTERFRQLLDRSSITQTELSKRLGFSSQAVSKWYTGKAEPDCNTLKTIANIFGVSIDYLLGNEEETIKIENRERERIALKNALVRTGFMMQNEDLTDELLDNVLAFLVINRRVLKMLPDSLSKKK